MSLADILQWADAIGARGRLVLQRRTGDRWIYVDERAVRATSAPAARSMSLEELDPALRSVPGLPLPLGALAIEALYDEFLDKDDTFRFERADAPPGQGVFLDLPLAGIVMEGMRHLDEWSELRRRYKNEAAHLQAAGGEQPAAPNALQLGLLGLAGQQVTLGQARLCLGLSRPALLRNVDALRRLGCLTIEGAPAGGNLVDKLIDKAGLLLRAEQFDEAAHVFGALLSADPSSRHIKRLLREAERAHVAHLYRQLPAQATVRLTPRLAEIDKRLTRSDREVLEHVNDRWDVATLVMASRLREVETLKSLQRLHRMEAIELSLPEASG